MIADSGFRIADGLRHYRRELTCLGALALAASVVAVSGCITHPQHPAATQPATEIDLATTQPTYWYAQPAAAQAYGQSFETVWNVCKAVARSYLFTLDRVDYRAGVITTVPLVSKQWFEPWRPDTGTAGQTFSNSLADTRRTLRFEVERNPDDTYTITPKVLVERESILEHHVTDVSQYRLAFSGPGQRIPARQAVTLDPETYPDVPARYWYPTGRDTAMEFQVAQRVTKALEQSRATARAGQGANAEAESAAPATPLASDGMITGVGPGGTYFINLGAADHVVPGMTFEVYNGRATLPTLESYGRDNPQSKGWMEVVSVGNGSSTCRVLQVVANPPRQGDQIFNFILRRGQPNHLALLGDFSNAPRKTLADLIQQWGGILDPTPTPSTDYVILGTAPTGPTARSTYEGARAQAEQLKRPLVSEERFDLLIRYYTPTPAKP